MQKKKSWLSHTPNLQVFVMLETTSFRALPSLLGRGRHLLFSTTCDASFGFFVLAHRETPFQLKKQKRENQGQAIFFLKKKIRLTIIGHLSCCSPSVLRRCRSYVIKIKNACNCFLTYKDALLFLFLQWKKLTEILLSLKNVVKNIRSMHPLACQRLGAKSATNSLVNLAVWRIITAITPERNHLGAKSVTNGLPDQVVWQNIYALTPLRTPARRRRKRR